MRILITGSEGFIGRHLMQYFNRHDEIFNPNGEIYDVISTNRKTLDLEDNEAVEHCLSFGGFDVVIHAAGYDANSPVVPRDQSICLEKNLRMFMNLVRCAEYYDRLIYFGSGSEVAKERRKLSMNEYECNWYPPDDSYGLSKWFMNKVAPLHGKIVNLRLFGVFGEYDDWRYRVVPNLCAQAIHFDRLVLKRNAMHDFMHIDDLCRAVEAIAESDQSVYASYNVCPSRPVTFRRLAEIVREVSGRDLQIECPKEIFHSYSGDNARFMNDFPGVKFTPIEIGIRRLYEYYDSHKEMIPKYEVLKWL